METKEKVFKFIEWYNSTDYRECFTTESQLEQKHINLLAAELIKQYEDLPKESKKLMKDYLNISI